MNKVNLIRPFPKFCYTIGMIPTSYKESLTYEEQLLWFCDFLQNTVIPTVNNNGLAVEELQNLFIQLQDFVNNYFNNLDVQEEINNKLDEMAEDGTLQEIITAYLQINGILAFNSVDEMKNSVNLINGSFAETYGFYSVNDGGKAKYKIREIIENETIDEITVISLENNLVAELIIENEMNVKQFGAKGDGINDDTLAFQTALNNCNIVFVPETLEYYKINNTLNLNSNSKIYGVGETSKILMPNNLLKIIFNLVNIKDIIIDNLKLCNESCQTGSTPDLTKNKLIYVENSENITIQNCTFENAYSRGILVFRTKNFYYLNNIFKNATFEMLMILPETENVFVDKCIFDNIISTYQNTYLFATGRTDTQTYEFGTKNVHVTNSKFLNNPNWEGIDTHACVGFYCENNYIENCKKGIMAVFGDTHPIITDEIKHGDIYIKNNVIVNPPQNADFGINAGVSASLDFIARNINIENNYIDGFGNSTTIGAIISQATKYLNILNNTIKNSKGTGMALTCIIQANIKNNQIIDSDTTYGIHFIAGCWFINVINNVIKNISFPTNLNVGIRSGLRTIAQFVDNEIVANTRYNTLGTLMTGAIGTNTTQIGQKGNFVKDEYGFVKYYCTDTVIHPAKTGSETNVALSGSSDTKIVTGNNAMYHLVEGEEITIPGAGLAGGDLTTVITEFINKNTFKIKDTILLSFENVNPSFTAGTWIEV